MTNPAASAPTRSPAEVITRSAALLTTLIGVFVTANGVLTSCSRERVAQYASFRQAVATEEAYWKNLLDEYQRTFDASMMGPANKERRDAKLFAINQLSAHLVPDFKEHEGVPEVVRSTAHDQFKAMQQNLRSVLFDPKASGETVAETLALGAHEANERDKLKPPSGDLLQTPDSSAVAIEEPGAIVPNLATVVLTPGLAQGWDVDVFWCRNARGAENFAAASAAATALASNARDGAQLAPGVRLGRIRLRPLLEEVNRRPSYQISGFVVRRDEQSGEIAAATAIRTVVNAAQTSRFELQRSNINTQWYVSLFACAGGPERTTTTVVDAATVPAS